MVVKIVHDDLVEMLGGATSAARTSSATPPVPILMVGLQGSGKTTTTAKIALRLTKRERKKVLMASLERARPAAQSSWRSSASRPASRRCRSSPGEPPVAIAKRARGDGAARRL